MSPTFTKYSILALAVLLGLAYIASGINKLGAGEHLNPEYAALGIGQLGTYFIGFAEMGLGVGLLVPSSRRVTVMLILPWALGAIGTLVFKNQMVGGMLYPALGFTAVGGVIYYLLGKQPKEED